ncbi:MAG: 3-oxoacyl-[acyl-carrier-protein] synthase-3, partial [Pseudohongiellaceae bacterium]
TAPLVQHALGLPQDISAFDISLGCSGYPSALNQAAALIESQRAAKVLLITADRMTAYTTHAGRDVQTIFGDGATASLIVAHTDTAKSSASSAARGVIGQGKFGSDGSGAEKLWVPTSGTRGFAGQVTRDVPSPTLEMNGLDVFAFTLRVVGKHVQQFLASQGLAIGDVDLFVFHQANRFMIEHLRRRLKIDSEHFAVHIAEVGNTVASTIPLALEQALLKGQIQPGQRVMLVGFGVGYSWGSVLLDY